MTVHIRPIDEMTTRERLAYLVDRAQFDEEQAREALEAAIAKATAYLDDMRSNLDSGFMPSTSTGGDTYAGSEGAKVDQAAAKYAAVVRARVAVDWIDAAPEATRESE